MNFWKLVGIFLKFLWWKINYFRILEIVRKFRKCGIISSLLIRVFLKNCWDMLGNFDVENLFYWIIGIVEIIEKCWNCGIHLHHDCVKKG